MNSTVLSSISDDAKGLDPITFAVVKSGVDALVDEMAYVIVRTARSEIVKDLFDFSAAICDADGNMVAMARTAAIHIGAVPDAIESVLETFGDDIHEGDAIIMNDPYHGGMHLPDIFMFMPIFHEGRKRGFAVTVCHHTDMGGRVPGSNASDSTEIYQEGVRIPPIKLIDKGVINKTLETIIKINVRVPDRVWGDLKSQIAACNTGITGMRKLFSQYGGDEVECYIRELINYAEQLTRNEIASWPDGTYRFSDIIDGDGIDDREIEICVAVTVSGSSLAVEFAGSSAKVKGAINATFSYTKAATYLAVRCLLGHDVPNNVGMFRCVHISVPRGTILRAAMPSACAARALTGYRVFDAMLGALAQIVPDRVPAAGEGGNSVICISGLRENGRPFIIVDMITGTWGARPNKDGIEGITNPSQNMSNTPVEILELEHPIRIEEYGFAPDTCGAGKWRGGVGLKRSYRILSDQALLQLRTDRTATKPYGLFGGHGAELSLSWVEIDGKKQTISGKCTMILPHMSLFHHRQAGGGGFGPPSERSKERIKSDLLDGKITPSHAEKHYHWKSDGANEVANAVVDVQ